MSGQIFISYRREDASYPAGRLYDNLHSRFPHNEIFMDVDSIKPGIDFVQTIEERVGACDVLVAVIGKRWLTASDEEGRRRLDNSEDFVRVEVGTALKRGVRVIPVLVEGASMPRSGDLPEDLKPLVRRNALSVSHDRFRADAARLIDSVGEVLEAAQAERPARPPEGPQKLRGRASGQGKPEPLPSLGAGAGAPPPDRAPNKGVRRDKGLSKAISPQAAIIKLRLQQPSLAISTLVRQLEQGGVLQPGTFSLSSVYRLLVSQGLDWPRLIAENSGPTKAFETELANALWMADVMDGPILRVGDRAVPTSFLFALLDDCSRLVPHAQYYDNQKLHSLLDCLKEAFGRRGLPEKLYSDQGKIFTCAHLQCAWMPLSHWTQRSLEVPVHLRGRRVQLRYEPFQWSVLEVWYQDKFAGLGRRCDKQLNAKTYNSTDYER